MFATLLINYRMLTARGITKSYGSLKVLKGIDLQVKEGEIISIVGASGAGKSTLLHILGTLDKPDDGSLHLNDEDLLRLNPKQIAKFRNSRVGFVFQFHNLLPEFTALENVCIPGYISKNSTQAVENEGKRLLMLLGIQERADHKPSQLSGGELQRAAVARALINNPAIVFADEPSGNLDSKNASELHNLFFKLREELNQTFVIVTHNEDLAAMADRTLEIRDGMIVNIIKDH
jgi:lipoprotein-releasing system ATP-binding protein